MKLLNTILLLTLTALLAACSVNPNQTGNRQDLQLIWGGGDDDDDFFEEEQAERESRAADDSTEEAKIHKNIVSEEGEELAENEDTDNRLVIPYREGEGFIFEGGADAED